MHYQKKHGKFSWIQYEIILMIILILCISFCLSYETQTSFKNVLSITELGTISILHDEAAIKAFEDKGRPIIYFHHDACQFVTVYNSDESLKSILMLNNVEPLYEQIDSEKNWWPIFRSMDKGVIDIVTNEVNMEIHHQWVRFDNGVEYLVVYNINDSQNIRFNVYHIVSYIALILGFVILISAIYWRYNGIARRYEQVNSIVNDIIRK